MNTRNPNAPLSMRGLFNRIFSGPLIRRALNDPVLAKRRLRVEKLARLIPPASGATFTAGTLGGVPVEWVAHPVGGARGFVLYLHGGGYMLGSPRTHRSLTSRIARTARVCVVAPDYRLAPEHPFPAALEDALAVYKALLAQDIPANKITLAGDSAGGGLALALALAIKAAPLPPPAGIICLSPWTDLSLSGDSMTTRAKQEVILPPNFGPEASRYYLGEQDRKQPLASPLFADLSGLPPVFIQVGGLEILHDDATRFAQAATRQGVPVTLQTWPHVWHVWQLNGGLMPEADAAITAIGEFIHSRLTGRL